MIITNGKIYTMEDEDKIIENGFVKIKDGKIQEVGDMSFLVEKDGYEIVDAKGGYVLPGIIDAHSHMGVYADSSGWQDMDVNEVTDPLTPQLRAIDAINPMARSFEDCLSIGVTTVITGPGSANPIGGQLAAIKTHGKRIEDIIIKAPVAMKMALGENPKGAYGQHGKAPKTRMATAAMIREIFFKAKEYMEAKEKAEEDKKPKFDFKLESLIPVLKREIPAHIHCHKADDIYTAIRISKEFNLDLVLVHCSEGHLIIDDLKEEGYNVISGPHLTARSKPEVKNKTFATPGILASAGIVTAITVDHPVVPIENLLVCAGLAVREGMSEIDALKAVTINGAKAGRIDDKVGSLKAGKDADVVIFDKNPLDLQARATLVLIDGKKIR